MRHGSPSDGVSSRAGTIGAMAVFKRKYRLGKTVWCFVIDAPGSTRENRRQIKESGFPTKAAAERAEAERRITEQQKYELEKAGLPDVPLPTTLADLMRDFFAHTQRRSSRRRPSNAIVSRRTICTPICSRCPLPRLSRCILRRNGTGYWSQEVAFVRRACRARLLRRRCETWRESSPAHLPARSSGV